jgi:hypothetical protein
MPSLRRRFLKSAAGVAAGLSMPCDNVEAQLVPAAALPALAATPPRLPTLRLGKYDVSRLIIGGNPFYGYSHFNRLFSTHMAEWATPERVCATLKQCEENGVNTWQFSHTDRTISDLKRHREQNGKMQWLLLSHAPIENDHKLIRDVVKLNPIGIVHHGGSAERKRRQGKLNEVHDFLKSVRDSGVLVGLSTHDPQLLEEVQAKDWDIDFFMTALYYLSRSNEEWEKVLGQRPIGEIYLPSDPPKMCKVIRQTPKPCLVYKVLAAGRLTDSPQTIDKAFQFVFDNVKPQDGMIIGMYPRYFDQVRDNADRVRRILTVRS